MDLVDSVRFVRLVRTALKEQPELARMMTYTRDILQWREEFAPYSKYGENAHPAALVPHLDEVLQREGVTEFDKRVIGAFLIKRDYSGRAKDISQELYRVQLEQSSLSEHSPEIAETLLALSQLEGEREKEQDLRASKVVGDYLRDQELAPDMRADLAKIYLSKLERDEALRELADVEAVAVALRDLLMRSSYGATGNLFDGGEMLLFVTENLAVVPLELQREIYEGWTLALKENAEAVLKQKLGSTRKLRLSEVIFDFMDGGKRFPLPQTLSDELVENFSGDLDMMQRLLRSGNEELFDKLLPDADRDFRLNSREYSAATFELQEEMWEVLSEQNRVRLICYLASLRDYHEWSKSEGSVGYRKDERALAAAKLFVSNPPEEQEVRLRAIDDLEYSEEALTVLMPLFSERLKDDLPALAKNHRGEVSYLLRWLKAGGRESIEAFSPDSKQPLRMSYVRVYEPALAELEELMSPLLSEPEGMRFKCDLAVLQDPRAKDEEEVVLPVRATRLEEAARYILANPLPELHREEEKTCITLLVNAGLDEALSQELMLRHAKVLEEFDEETLLALRPAERQLFVLQLRASLAKGEVIAAMRCLQILAGSEAQVSERWHLLALVLPKIALPLIAQVAGENDGVDEQLTAEVKDLSGQLFKLTFGKEEMRLPDAAQRAVLFMAFATHCLGGDKAGFKKLQGDIPAKARQKVGSLAQGPRNWRVTTDSVLTPAQPFYFDGESYQSEEFKPLRQLLFAKIQKHSFAELLGSQDEVNPLTLLTRLRLQVSDVEMSEDDFSSGRGNLDLISSAIMAEDQDLFLSLLPTKLEAYFEAQSSEQPSNNSSYRSRNHQFLHTVRVNRRNPARTQEVDLIEDEFQRLHFEVFMSSYLGTSDIRGERGGLRIDDDEAMAEVLALLPESGPARVQILAILAGKMQPGSPLARALVEEAVVEGSELDRALNTPDLIAQRVHLDTFVFGWICAMFADDWSVLDFQFQHDSKEAIAGLLVECACRQALYQVAGEPGTMKEVMERLSNYGIDRTDPTAQAWLELIGLVGGAKTSSWRDYIQTLDEEQKRLAQVEMAAALQKVLSSLEKVDFSNHVKSRWQPNWRSKLKKVWQNPMARERSKRVLAAIVKDELEVFSVAQVSIEKRMSWVLEGFDWRQVKSSIEESCEGEVEERLLIELALKGKAPEVSQGDFLTFLERVAPLAIPESREGSQLWFKLAEGHISAGNLAGAKAANEKIDPEYFEDYEIKRLRDQLGRLEEGAGE